MVTNQDCSTGPHSGGTVGVLQELQAFDLSELSEHWQDIVAALIARAVRVDRPAALSLQEKLLNNWGRQHLVNFLIDQGDLPVAAEVLESFTDHEICLRTTRAIADSTSGSAWLKVRLSRSPDWRPLRRGSASICRRLTA